MMYPRLRLLRELLSDDGVIFISIDDNEVHNLRSIMDEIFGEENILATLIWKKKQGGENDSSNFVIEHEYVLVYAKDSKNTVTYLDNDYQISYQYKDENGEYGLVTLDKS